MSRGDSGRISNITYAGPASNVESTFSAVKRKFGDSVRSRNDAAMVNEVLCKFVAHNLCCLIMEQETLGIIPILWKGEATDDGDPAILPMRNAIGQGATQFGGSR